jgi:hypothetical protein
METFTFTKDELVKAFEKWDKEWIESPSEFKKLEVVDASKQADTLISYLLEIKS